MKKLFALVGVFFMVAGLGMAVGCGGDDDDDDSGKGGNTNQGGNSSQGGNSTQQTCQTSYLCMGGCKCTDGPKKDSPCCDPEDSSCTENKCDQLCYYCQ